MAKSKNLKKQWFPIIAPKLFNNTVLGETHVYDINAAVGKGVKQNLMNLTRDGKKQNINISFEINKVEAGKAYADMTGYNLMQSSVKRFVRRNIDKIEMSFVCSTHDKKSMRIKPLVITRTSSSNSVGTRMRRTAETFIRNYIGKINYDLFTQDLVARRMQDALRRHLSKIHPVRICEVRSMKLAKMDEGDVIVKEAKEISESEVKEEKKGVAVQEKEVQEVKKAEEPKTEEKTAEPAKVEEKAQASE